MKMPNSQVLQVYVRCLISEGQKMNEQSLSPTQKEPVVVDWENVYFVKRPRQRHFSVQLIQKERIWAPVMKALRQTVKDFDSLDAFHSKRILSVLMMMPED